MYICLRLWSLEGNVYLRVCWIINNWEVIRLKVVVGVL